jgi:hypothetical protein
VRASARRSPPVSAMIGRLNLPGPETVQTRLPASCQSIRKARSRVAAGPCNIATQRRGVPSEPDRRRNGPPRAPASKREHLLHPGESWSRRVVPYTHHTANRLSSQHDEDLADKAVQSSAFKGTECVVANAVNKKITGDIFLMRRINPHGNELAHREASPEGGLNLIGPIRTPPASAIVAQSLLSGRSYRFLRVCLRLPRPRRPYYVKSDLPECSKSSRRSRTCDESRRGVSTVSNAGGLYAYAR